jgi:hypothetical protein
MAFDVQFLLSRNEAFQSRTAIACAQVALAVAVEAQGAMSLTKWNKRGDLAQRVLQSPDSVVVRFVTALVTIAGATAAATDAQLVTAVQGFWDAMAGVRAGE